MGSNPIIHLATDFYRHREFLLFKQNVAGSSPVNGITPIVAQMVERLPTYSPPILLEHMVFLYAVTANDS